MVDGLEVCVDHGQPGGVPLTHADDPVLLYRDPAGHGGEEGEGGEQQHAHRHPERQAGGDLQHLLQYNKERVELYR